jgi:hypothetical protein
MRRCAKAIFTNSAHNASEYSQPTEGPPLSRIKIERIFSGDLIGSSTVELLACQKNQENFAYLGADRFTGKLANLVGSFVFQHGGIHAKGDSRPFGYIVSGSGSGQLHGLEGELTISVSASGEHSIELEYAILEN